MGSKGELPRGFLPRSPRFGCVLGESLGEGLSGVLDEVSCRVFGELQVVYAVAVSTQCPCTRSWPVW